jgi:hypothetical protein
LYDNDATTDRISFPSDQEATLIGPSDQIHRLLSAQAQSLQHTPKKMSFSASVQASETLTKTRNGDQGLKGEEISESAQRVLRCGRDAKKVSSNVLVGRTVIADFGCRSNWSFSRQGMLALWR